MGSKFSYTSNEVLQKIYCCVINSKYHHIQC